MDQGVLFPIWSIIAFPALNVCIILCNVVKMFYIMIHVFTFIIIIINYHHHHYHHASSHQITRRSSSLAIRPRISPPRQILPKSDRGLFQIILDQITGYVYSFLYQAKKYPGKHLSQNNKRY